MPNEQKDKRLFAMPAGWQVSMAILVFMHFSGIVGIQSSFKDLFLLCTPFTLLLSITLLFWNHTEYNKSFFIFSALTFLTAYFIEVLGVKTGMIFGNYSYGNTLGIKLFDVPVLIGINWLLLIYCVGVIFNTLQVSSIIKSMFGATLLTLLDFFIETVAVKYDYWKWANDTPPIQNFISWFILSFLLLLFFNSMNFNKNNKLAHGLFIIQLVFFVTLSIL